MAVKIRIALTGTKNAPVYRIVAADSRCKRDGRFIEHLGTYNPRSHQITKFHDERIDYWLSQGAEITDTVRKIRKKHLTVAKAA